MLPDTVVHIGPHERADNPQSRTGWTAQLLDILSTGFNSSLKEYHDSLTKKADGQKTASLQRPSLSAVRDPLFSTKAADFTSGPNTGEVERALEQIAEQQIANRAPALMPYWLGFQLLKQTDDNTRVCGIFAFKVDAELVYIPVFCINGEVQGHEMMYLVSQDRFVPSDEKQVNYLLSRKPIEPGKVELRDRSEIRQRATLRPDYMSSGLKLSSLSSIPRLPKTVLEDAMRCLFKEAATTSVLNSLRFKQAMIGLRLSDLFDLSAKATKLASCWGSDYPVYSRLIDYALDGMSLHAMDETWQKRAGIAKQLGIVPVKKPTLSEYLKSQVKKAKVKEAKVKEEYVSVKTASEMPDCQFDFMSTDAIDKLHRRGFYVTDTRDQTKLAAVAVANDNQSVKNPHLPGIYNVFTVDGSFKKCVILRPWEPDDGRCSCSDSDYFVFDPDSGSWVAADRPNILVDASQPEGDWFELISKGNRPRKTDETGYDEKGSTFLIAPDGNTYAGTFEKGEDGVFYEYSKSLTPIPGQSGFKVLPEGKDHCKHITISPDTKLVRYENKGLVLGSFSLWQESLYRNTLPLRVRKRERTSGRYSVDGLPEMGKAAAMEALMLHHHLSEKDAEYLLDLTDAQFPVPVHARRGKIAASPSRDPLSVDFPVKDLSTDWLTGMDTEQDLETSERVDSLANDRPEHPMDFWPGSIDSQDVQGTPPQPNAHDLQMATRASQSGQREFVSSQMLMSLLREIDDEGIISQYISVFEKACDALGRLYMQVLWRVDAFEERFGEAQLKEFKEMLLELFQRTGDFVCYLRQRDVRPESRLSLEHVTDIGEDFGQ